MTTADEIMRLAYAWAESNSSCNTPLGNLVCRCPETEAALRVAVESLVAERDAMKAALTRIEKWHGEFPPTGEFWDAERTRPISYAVKHGSNGERDYMREVARAALKGKT